MIRVLFPFVVFSLQHPGMVLSYFHHITLHPFADLTANLIISTHDPVAHPLPEQDHNAQGHPADQHQPRQLGVLHAQPFLLVGCGLSVVIPLTLGLKQIVNC